MPVHEFGGPWTTDKLGRVQRYLTAYRTALKNTSFELHYIDGFAGTGYRAARSRYKESTLRFPELDQFAKGSAVVALEVNPPFHRYKFIEKSKGRANALERLKDRFEQPGLRIEVIPKEANAAILHICHTTDWRRSRAVMFLDPYGMQVDWSTIVAVAKTRAVDLWYLFPAGIGVGRLLTRSGKMPPSWERRLDRCLGTRAWRDVFYKSNVTDDLFGRRIEKIERVGNVDDIREFFQVRLGSIFAAVSKNTLTLENRMRSQMYALYFACGNERGAKVALPIANHILST